MQNYSNTNYQTGFTIVELMVVVVIIAIISAVAIPAYNNTLTKTDNVANQENKVVWLSLVIWPVIAFRPVLLEYM